MGEATCTLVCRRSHVDPSVRRCTSRANRRIYVSRRSSRVLFRIEVYLFGRVRINRRRGINYR